MDRGVTLLFPPPLLFSVLHASQSAQLRERERAREVVREGENEM